MSESTIFRRRIEEPEESVEPPKPRETPNLIEVLEDGALKDSDAVDEVIHESPLDEWEMEHGKYGHEYFDIKEIAHEFPLKANFGIVDKYIREIITEEGNELTKDEWQKKIVEIEAEANSLKLKPYERVKRLADYIKVIKKIRDLEKRKKLYQV